MWFMQNYGLQCEGKSFPPCTNLNLNEIFNCQSLNVLMMVAVAMISSNNYRIRKAFWYLAIYESFCNTL